MCIDVGSSDWACLDSWWDAYEQVPLGRRTSTDTTCGQGPADWEDVDAWWAMSADSWVPAAGSDVLCVVDGEGLADDWAGLDVWWERFADTGHETAVELADVLEQLNTEWARADALFNTDPLAADLTRERVARGPLTPSGEVAWSRWLARLLRTSPALVTELFGVSVEDAPADVLREDQLAKPEGGFRRPDILVCHADRGVSIEVKLGDENYEKTAETAALVEAEYDELAWTHTLLLPKHKHGRLEAVVGPRIEHQSDGHQQISWDDPGPVDVVYWRDVSAALRSVLRRGDGPDEHWAANAYLFCAVVEQQLLEFQPQPVVEQLATPADVVDAIRPIQVADTLEEQLTYLRERASI